MVVPAFRHSESYGFFSPLLFIAWLAPRYLHEVVPEARQSHREVFASMSESLDKFQKQANQKSLFGAFLVTRGAVAQRIGRLNILGLIHAGYVRILTILPPLAKHS